MNISRFLSMCQIIFSSFVQAESKSIPEKVSFHVLSELNEEIKVNLVSSQTFLANENVPVWVPERGKPTKLKQLKYAMKNLTPFTVYRDPETCAAAVYIHKREQFEGTIGHHHFIRGLRYDSKAGQVEPTVDTVLVSPLKKHGNRLAKNRDPPIVKAGKSSTSGIQSLTKYPDIVYVETLVMVHYDITEHLEYDATAIVMYVLTLFNSVDMLFSGIQIPNIRINIAGIIIGTSLPSFPQFILLSCYVGNANNQEALNIETECGYNAIKKTLKNYETLPHQSYDIVIFLTRYQLLGYESINYQGEDRHIQIKAYGRAFVPSNTNGYKQSLNDKGMAIVSDPESLKFFPTVAHEIAHLLGVPHDGGPLWTEDGTCNAHIMRKDNSFCNKCLTFGGATPSYLKIFFGSRDGCSFHNKPRSLNNPSMPQLFWNPDEQCQCYGYPAAYKPKHRLPIRDMFSSRKRCKSLLKCVDEHNKVYKTTFYMDGTPCDRSGIGKKLCWNNKCVFQHDDLGEHNVLEE